MGPTRYRKRPVEVEAMHFDGTREVASEIAAWCNRHRVYPLLTLEQPETPNLHEKISLVIDTLEGAMRVSGGDWVIRGIRGEFYPCKPDVFAVTYEEVR